MDSRYLRRAGLLFCIGSIPYATGCAPTAYRARIQAPYSYDRILAIREAGERRDRQAVPLLVDRLEDEDAAVRFYTILALERITGERFGYRYENAATKNRAAVERWRKFALADPPESTVIVPPASQPGP